MIMVTMFNYHFQCPSQLTIIIIQSNRITIIPSKTKQNLSNYLQNIFFKVFFFFFFFFKVKAHDYGYNVQLSFLVPILANNNNHSKQQNHYYSQQNKTKLVKLSLEYFFQSIFFNFLILPSPQSSHSFNNQTISTYSNITPRNIQQLFPMSTLPIMIPFPLLSFLNRVRIMNIHNRTILLHTKNTKSAHGHAACKKK
eukprot:TRINITY_DN838_c0_g1_i2.p1 TRINITY_DN838_c0_g1~~TRINITY_DN838_c0_g1_i2.p1  ORF type:complete len:197 (+),score=-10.64 TRINITY_DN838_c0_g1_i2:53-643(+)